MTKGKRQKTQKNEIKNKINTINSNKIDSLQRSINLIRNNKANKEKE